MKNLLIVLLAMSLSGILFAADKITREFNVAEGEKLEVDLDAGGDIEIKGWGNDVVSVVVLIEDYDQEDYEIDVEQYSKGVSVNIDTRRHRRHSGDLLVKINVPINFDLELKTMGGDVKIEGVTGIIEGETMGGDLELSGLKGQIDFSTMGGDISLKDSDLDGEVSTMGGDVDFEDVVGDVKGSSMGGDVIYKNVKKRDGRSSGKEVQISTMGGEIKVDEALFGANVSTMGGDIHIKMAGKHVKAKTMGGDIEIDKIDGSVEANTMGGDVTVTMVGDPDKGDREVEISSKGGDIRLTVPKGLSMDFDIKLSLTHRGEDYKIYSDFPINIEEPDEWDYSWGSKRKNIYGTGEVKGGKHKIKIETVNGDIHILKGN